MDFEFSIVITTTDNDESARAIAHAALAARLAACVQIVPIRSHYVWKDELREESEFLLQMKTRTENYQKLAALIRSAHHYEVPEILRVDIAEGDRAYLDWVDRFSRP